MRYITKEEAQKKYIVYYVIDHEDNGRRYQFYSENEARRWKNELVNDFGTNPENVSILEREYDRYGNWTQQKYI